MHIDAYININIIVIYLKIDNAKKKTKNFDEYRNRAEEEKEIDDLNSII